MPETSALWGGFVPRPWRGVWGPKPAVVEPVAGRCGKGRVGNARVRYDVLCLGWRGSGKKIVSSGLRRQTFSMAGERMFRILSSSRYASRPSALAIRMSSTGHLAGLRSMDSSSVCLSAGTKRMCPLGMRMRVDIFWCPRMACDVHGESSHTGRVMTTRNGASVFSEDARAWRTACSMSSGSYSGFAMHEAVQRYRKESRIAPK